MKYWNGSTWVELDAKNADTLDGKHAQYFDDKIGILSGKGGLVEKANKSELENLNNTVSTHLANNTTNPSGNKIFHVEVVSSFPAHADGKVIFHTGEAKFFGSVNGEWV